MSELRPGQTERITHLFRRGYSLDLVSELGLANGWTREQARTVLAAQGWALDWTGRLQPQYLKATVKGSPSIATADPERILNAGIDHENHEIRRIAQNTERMIERLRTALLDQERRDAATASARQEAVQAVFGIVPLYRGLVEDAKAS